MPPEGGRGGRPLDRDGRRAPGIRCQGGGSLLESWLTGRGHPDRRCATPRRGLQTLSPGRRRDLGLRGAAAGRGFRLLVGRGRGRRWDRLLGLCGQGARDGVRVDGHRPPLLFGRVPVVAIGSPGRPVELDEAHLAAQAELLRELDHPVGRAAQQRRELGRRQPRALGDELDDPDPPRGLPPGRGDRWAGGVHIPAGRAGQAIGHLVVSPGRSLGGRGQHLRLRARARLRRTGRVLTRGTNELGRVTVPGRNSGPLRAVHLLLYRQHGEPHPLPALGLCERQGVESLERSGHLGRVAPGVSAERHDACAPQGAQAVEHVLLRLGEEGAIHGGDHGVSPRSNQRRKSRQHAACARWGSPDSGSRRSPSDQAARCRSAAAK